MEKLGLCVLLAICPCTTAITADNSSTTQATRTFSPTTSTTVTKNITTSPTTVRPTSEPADTCERRHSSCGDCVKEMKCYWCGGDDTCKRYPAAKVIPRDCEGNDWFWKQCVIPGYILIYVIPSVSFVLLVVLGCCIYCLCCRNRCRKSFRKDDREVQRRREEIKQRYAERRAERKMKTDAIRQKYGLLSNEDDAEVA
ncbi:pituitary tumor-transforming gene 1 protein-interacting protein-like [Montipora foliosa]|uniref:pituitary tumor-transforming gene 1 protein-interacting protein-like n=1 Tax=Montipora foliosa TaxID=591990 RepID=UPI0035F1A3CF